MLRGEPLKIPKGSSPDNMPTPFVRGIPWSLEILRYI